ncbi:hypothetical protein Tsp_15220, partial [Trichinella spiralis]|uniref:hypothetical protein n=1 Tax=Trichinella spiralis TaxID=6334 RepID=UPI0001EFE2CD
MRQVRSGVCNSDLSGPKAGKERKTVEPRKAQANIATTEHGWSRFQMIKAVAHGPHGRKRLVNCLFDTGGERSLVRQDVVDELKLAAKLTRFPFAVLGASESLASVEIHSILAHFVTENRPQEKSNWKQLTAPYPAKNFWQTRIPKDWASSFRTWTLTREVGEADITPCHHSNWNSLFPLPLEPSGIPGGKDDPSSVESPFS